jgi:hypothetical protein
MCSTRILCRLRFRANRWKTPKQPVKEVLKEAVSSLRQLEDERLGKLVLNAKLFVDRAKGVMKLLDSWAKHQTPARLGELVGGLYRLWQVGSLHALLDTIPDRTMDPNSRKNLLNIVSKVARYREAARFLYHTAKKFPLARQMKIILVNLPKKAFREILANQYTPILRSTVSQITAPYGQWDLGHICRLLNTTELEASGQFAQQTRRTLKEGKIHAEIQLLFYCELRGSELPPRVVCSSKDACFLCNTFILMHGKMHTPRYHGRLYPGWRLPSFSELSDVEQRFNQALENHVRNSLRTLLSRQQKTVYPDPMESTLLTLPTSVSTLRSLTLSDAVTGEKREIMQPPPPDDTGTENNPLISSSPQAPSVLSENTPRANSARTEAATAGAEKNAKIHLSNDIASQPVVSRPHGLSSESTVDDNGELTQGRMLSRSIEVDNTSRLYTAGPLEVQIEYSTGPSLMISNSTPRKLAYGIEWLTVEEAERLQEHQATSIIDAESLEGEISHEVDDLNCLYIAARGSVLKIFLRPKIA